MLSLRNERGLRNCLLCGEVWGQLLCSQLLLSSWGKVWEGSPTGGQGGQAHGHNGVPQHGQCSAIHASFLGSDCQISQLPIPLGALMVGRAARESRLSGDLVTLDKLPGGYSAEQAG